MGILTVFICLSACAIKHEYRPGLIIKANKTYKHSPHSHATYIPLRQNATKIENML